ncbi:hypothetical protein B0A49_12131 [Cryomyces minteri]|uniref:MT-A70-domain-containing protein n=1 Tax=Cryomyces minteri TaxID=331657 RepID=A0A4U0W6P8_9PEZI|nr:hypothetical protein B0A49_12131 [Cryomyces minteri]
MPPETPSTSILYQNEGQTITLIDIPTSIAVAQELNDEDITLLSSAPQEVPYTSNEPKSSKAKERVRSNTVDAELHDTYVRLIREALAEIRAHHTSPWYLPRTLAPERARLPKKRKASTFDSGKETGAGRDDRTEQDFSQDYEAHDGTATTLPFDLFENLVYYGDEGMSTTQPARSSYQFCSTPWDALIPRNPPFAPWTSLYHNPLSVSARLLVMPPHHSSALDTPSPPPYTFRLPPHSAFLLSDCNTPFPSPSYTPSTAPQFDLILLDPPWPNRSARRRSAYALSPSLADLRHLLLSTHIEQTLAPAGLVGVWITNRAAVRELVLGPAGLFEHWGLVLAEEWVWVKVTAYGEPVTDVDSVTRRVVAAVPVLHSLKPSVRELVAPLMPHPTDYEALEVFARYLVAGWWSWGNEALKFNWEGAWGRSAVRGRSGG